ncbi:hypothetical protein Tco_0450512 [Tanacetum coccineum]
MGDANPIRTLGYYSKPSHEGYRNTIELPVGNNVVSLRSDTIRLVQNGCSFHGLRSEDPNQHLKDFLKLVDSLDLDGENKERTRLHVLSTSDRRLIELENQVQRLMKAHLAPTLPTQVKKITTSCEICSGPYDTRYCMEDPEQAFVEYVSSQGLVSNFMASQDARLSKFEADFKQQQSEMTKKINTVLKAITGRMAGALPRDTVKNPKLNINSTTSVLSARSYPTVVERNNQKNPEPTLEDEFQDFYLNLPVLEVLAHAPIYNAILDKYVESLELGKNELAFVQGEVSAKMEDPGLFTLPCRLGGSKPFDTLADLGSCVNIIPLYLFKKLNIELLEETDHIFGKDFLDCHLPGEWEIARDDEINPFKDVLVFRRMVEFLGAIPINLKSNMWESKDLINNPINWNKPPKNGDGSWHAKIKLTDPDGEEFTKTLQSIPTTRNLFERESPREIIDLDHFYDT